MREKRGGGKERGKKERKRRRKERDLGEGLSERARTQKEGRREAMADLWSPGTACLKEAPLRSLGNTGAASCWEQRVRPGSGCEGVFARLWVQLAAVLGGADQSGKPGVVALACHPCCKGTTSRRALL